MWLIEYKPYSIHFGFMFTVVTISYFIVTTLLHLSNGCLGPKMTGKKLFPWHLNLLVKSYLYVVSTLYIHAVSTIFIRIASKLQ